MKIICNMKDTISFELMESKRTLNFYLAEIETETGIIRKSLNHHFDHFCCDKKCC